MSNQQSGVLRVNSAGVEAHVAVLNAQVKQLRQQAQTMQSADATMVGDRWDGDTQREFQRLQKQFNAAFADFHQKLDKFRGSTDLNHQMMRATEKKNLNALQ